MFPELPVARGGEATWTLRIAHEAPCAAPLEKLGEDRVEGPVSVRLHRIAEGFRLDYDDTGLFDVTDSGRAIVWHPGPAATEENARMDMLGRVLPLALYAAGNPCLHASAVAFGERVVAFLAPKFHGKSTLALSLVDAGARLVTDDALIVEMGPVPHARPGVQAVRLWEDSVTAVRGEAGCAAIDVTGKYRFESLPEPQRVTERLPIAAFYVLTPEVPTGAGGAAAVRTPLPPVRAALALLAQSKQGVVLGGSEAPVNLARMVALADSVPVYSLTLARDFGRLPDVVAQLMDWHGAHHVAAGLEAS
jgi:hypothetical protein